MINKKFQIYFIGIGGVSMSSLAKLLLRFSQVVIGSDKAKNEWTDELSEMGVKIYYEFNENNIDLINSDIIVYTDAVNTNDKEIELAKKLNKKIISRAKLLYEITKAFRHTIAIAGSHGKTTCTSMCAHILNASKILFTAHIGGKDSKFSNFYMTGKDFFVTEACEYKKNILNLYPEKSIILNINKDHMECYKDEKDLIDTFYMFSKRSRTSFVCADDPNLINFKDCVTFGINNKKADYIATNLIQHKEKYSFSLIEFGRELCRVNLRASGKFNIYNSLAAFSLMRSYGFSENDICKGLEDFSCVKRRFECIGTFNGVDLICDYAHHPCEIREVVDTAKKICLHELYVVFQPHTYSRTILLKDEFIDTLQRIKNLMIYKTYAAREKYNEEGSGYMLSKLIPNSLYAETVYEIKLWIEKTVKPGDIVLFLGAGDIYYLAKYLASLFKKI